MAAGWQEEAWAFAHGAAQRASQKAKCYVMEVNPFLDRSIPLAARIASGVMLVAVVAALIWAIVLLAGAAGHPYLVLLVAAVACGFNTVAAIRRWMRLPNKP